jgi:hypothetical protein
MRVFSESEQSLLRVVEQFEQVEKYHRITPVQLLIAFEQKDIDRLLDDEVLEKVKLKSFSQKVKGVRFTSVGLRLWLTFTGQEEPRVVITAAGLLARDVYLHTCLSFSGEAMTKSQILEHHSKRALAEAFEQGLVAKVKIRQKGHEVIKGYILTCAAYAYLKGNNLI